MTLNNDMKVYIKTLVDVTNTNVRRGDNLLEKNQQSNFDTVIQTVGLRVNAIPELCTVEKEDLKKHKFGSVFKGKQNVWTIVMNYEFEGALTEDILIEDFLLVPIITGLNESDTINPKIFDTKSNKCNIYFVVEDK